MKKKLELVSGQIRHPFNFPNTILKCTGPHPSEIHEKEGKIIELDMFFLTKDFPKPHFLVIDRILDNYFHPTHKFCLVYLITHSDQYNNLKITEKLYNKSITKIDFSDSYITRDTFLVLLENIKKDKVYGLFNIDSLRKEIEY